MAAGSEGRFTGGKLSVGVGEKRASWTAAETGVALKTSAGKVAVVSVMGNTTGTTWEVKIYDSPTTTANLIFDWFTGGPALGSYALQAPMSNGIWVVISGTFPTNGVVTIVYE